MFDLSNHIAKFISYIALLTAFSAIIAGGVFGTVEIPATYTTVSKSQFDITIALTWWVEGAIAFALLLGFAYIVEYLYIISERLKSED
ncbi:hypothetical protein P9302_00420 [Brevibacillus agri]|uniref:hypothetical protein n=1 Tax=Brevibacillus agri TaxID=51101 RepID=UPI002E1C7E22|nr:hypothetical protein [Brevibacillus agri]